MTTVTISADVQANELGAIEAFLRNRLLLQGQAIEDLKADLAAKSEELQVVRAEAEQQVQSMREQLAVIKGQIRGAASATAAEGGGA